MNRKVLIDTSLLVALVDERDKWHQQAVAIQNELKRLDLFVIHLDLVYGEAVSVVARRAEEQRRSHTFDASMERLAVEVPRTELTWFLGETQKLFDQILALVRSSSGKLNFNDACIALFARREQIDMIASFDGDFDDLKWLRRIIRPDQLQE